MSTKLTADAVLSTAHSIDEPVSVSIDWTSESDALGNYSVVDHVHVVIITTMETTVHPKTSLITPPTPLL
jgi:hypothetical protein